MERIILENNLAPGDVLAMTPAIKAWKENFPDFELGYRGTAEALFENNPHVNLELKAEGRDDVRVLQCEYPDINFSNQRPAHFVEAYARFFSERIRHNIKVTHFEPEIYLSKNEASSPNPLRALYVLSIPYCIVAAGHKTDCPIKGWESERWQAVVDYFRGRLLFIQIGAEGEGHIQPKLNGVVNLVGRTENLRHLIRLFYHSQFVMCGITFPMHLSAALKKPNGEPRPCVVVAGGREPVHWEKYPHHRFLDTIGTLPCCAGEACWKSRPHTNQYPLEDNYTCYELTNKSLPKCMDQITPELVSFEISRIIKGGLIQELTPEERKLTQQIL